MTALPAVELAQVSVTYPSTGRGTTPVEALREVTLTLTHGAVLGLAGANGAGKTSLIELCAGTMAPTRGSVKWFGSPTWSGSVRRRIGFCPDVPALPRRLTGREVLRFFAALDGLVGEVADRRIDHLAERLRLHEALPRRVEFLSRGNLLRIGICQALLAKRDVLLCDESFAPLDPEAQLDLRQLLREVAHEGTAVLVSSHQLDQLGKVADEIAIVRNGVLVRHLDRDVVGAKRVLRIKVGSDKGPIAATLLTQFPGAWRTGEHVTIPWATTHFDEQAFRATVPGLGIHDIVGMEDISIEAMFLEAINQPRVSP